MKITLEQVQEAMPQGYSVIVIINGEYYDLEKPSADAERTQKKMNNEHKL